MDKHDTDRDVYLIYNSQFKINENYVAMYLKANCSNNTVQDICYFPFRNSKEDTQKYTNATCELMETTPYQHTLRIIEGREFENCQLICQFVKDADCMGADPYETKQAVDG